MSWFARKGASVREAHAALDTGAMLLDVRTAAEWKQGRAVGAVHMPPQKLEQRLSKLKDNTVYVICRSGNRSGSAAAALRRSGIDARNVRGGMLSWQRHGLPITKGAKR